MTDSPPLPECALVGPLREIAEGQAQLDSQIARALSSVWALARVLARQAAREDDAIERKAAGSEPVLHDEFSKSMNAGDD